jgi:hypothetical protein
LGLDVNIFLLLLLQSGHQHLKTFAFSTEGLQMLLEATHFFVPQRKHFFKASRFFLKLLHVDLLLIQFGVAFLKALLELLDLRVVP